MELLGMGREIIQFAILDRVVRSNQNADVSYRSSKQNFLIN